MPLINFLLAATVGLLAYLAGAEWPIVAIAVWGAHRVEVALTNQVGAVKLLSMLVNAEVRRVVAEQAVHEAQVAHIARNN